VVTIPQEYSNNLQASRYITTLYTFWLHFYHLPHFHTPEERTMAYEQLWPLSACMPAQWRRKVPYVITVYCRHAGYRRSKKTVLHLTGPQGDLGLFRAPVACLDSS
jgi:hypothetical protein